MEKKNSKISPVFFFSTDDVHKLQNDVGIKKSRKTELKFEKRNDPLFICFNPE